jgi:peptidoglycan/LPS O-acetylase OafA/YrhL
MDELQTSNVSAPTATPAVKPATQLTIEHRFAQLDVLRGIAILCVVLLHCIGVVFGRDPLVWDGMRRRFAPGIGRGVWPLLPFTYGWFGVPLFFVLSGFVIHHSFLRTKRFSARNFFWRRFWRIYPPYLAALVFFTLVDWRVGADPRAIPLQFVTHLLAVHNFFPKTFYGINGVFWSLGVEIQFYLLYPVVLWLRSKSSIRGAFLAILLVSTASFLVCYRVTNWNLPIRESTWSLTSNTWFLWVLGAYLAEMQETGKRVFRRPLLLMTGLAVAVVASSIYKPTSVLQFAIAGVLSAILIEWAMHCRPWSSVLARGLALLGICSYSMYLWHQPFLPRLSRLSSFLHLQAPWQRLLALSVVALPSLFALSYLLYVTVERGGQEVGRRALQWIVHREKSLLQPSPSLSDAAAVRETSDH